jgi:H+/Cl- antiporter ClcA
VNSGNVKLTSNNDTPYLDSLFGALVIGILGGLIGALFIIINNKVNYVRKKVLKQKWMKVLEACIIVTITVSSFYIAAALRDCVLASDDDFLV